MSGRQPAIQVVSHGPAIATAGSIIYDESPLDLTLGLHCNTENHIQDFRDFSNPVMSRFLEVEKLFVEQCPKNLQVWLQLSTCDPYIDQLLDLRTRTQRLFMAIFMDDLSQWATTRCAGARRVITGSISALSGSRVPTR